MSKTIIIAEIGECFNGDLKIAKRLIFAAKEAGCDIAKFQTLDYENIAEDDPEREWFRKIALNPEKMEYLIECGKEADIDILFSPENAKTAEWLLRAKCRDVKIASSSIIDTVLLKFVNKYFKQVFISTGMASFDEVNQAVKLLNRVGDLYIMHCISEYPTGPLLEKRGLKALSPGDVHLNMMRILMQKFPRSQIGYSDHTAGILVPVLAVAAGAKVIEKHITLDRERPIRNFLSGKDYLGTDHVLSIELNELREMVRQIREVESILGNWKWERTSAENILIDFLRRRFKDG